MWDLRVPRVLTAMLVGAGLAVAGATLQGVVRNPLADPYILGTASGAALGAAIGVLVPGPPRDGRVRRCQRPRVRRGAADRLSRAPASAAPGPAGLTRLLLTGYAVSSVLAALLTMVMYLSGLEPPRRSSRSCSAASAARRGAGSPSRPR